MILQKKQIFFVIIFFLIIVLKMFFHYCDTNDLMFMLMPVCFLVKIYTGSNYVYVVDKGFYFENLNMIVNKSCSGINFWMISFFVFAYLIIIRIKEYKNKKLIVLGIFLGTYLFSVLINSFRIYTSVLIQNYFRFVFIHNLKIIHEATGIIIYLFFLGLTYYILDKKLLKDHYENNS